MDQPSLLQLAIRILEEQGIVYMVVGSLASSAYGYPRYTNDIDIVIDLRPDQVERLCNAFSGSEFYVSSPAAMEAVQFRRQFNVIDTTSANKIDFMIARGDEWSKSQLSRRQVEQIIPGCTGYVAGPEDIIISKMLYYREGQSEKHLGDIANIVVVSGEKLETDYLNKWLEQFALTDIWNAVQTRLKSD